MKISRIKPNTIFKSGEYLLINPKINAVVPYLVIEPKQVFDFINKNQKKEDAQWTEKNTYIQDMEGADLKGRKKKIANVKTLHTGKYCLINADTNQKVPVNVPRAHILIENINKENKADWKIEDTIYISVKEAEEVGILTRKLSIVSEDGKAKTKEEYILGDMDFNTLVKAEDWLYGKVAKLKNKKKNGKVKKS